MQSSKRRVDMNKEWRSDTEGLVPGKLLMHEILQLQGMLRSNGGRRRKRWRRRRRRVTLPWIMLFPGGCCNKSHVQGGSLRCRIQRLWIRRWQTWLGFAGEKRGSVGLQWRPPFYPSTFPPFYPSTFSSSTFSPFHLRPSIRTLPAISLSFQWSTPSPSSPNPCLD